MRVARRIKGSEHNIALIADAIVIGIAQIIDIRNAKAETDRKSTV